MTKLLDKTALPAAASPNVTPTRAFRRVGASAYLLDHYLISMAPSTLAKLASIGGGPSFLKAGRYPVYPIEALDSWARERISPLVKSTADLKMRGVA